MTDKELHRRFLLLNLGIIRLFPIPEGFEVYVGGVWYTYRSIPDDPVTGGI